MISVLQEIDLNKPFRKRAELYIINDDKLVVGYSSKSKTYSIPGGGIDFGETPKQAAIRETLEEIGVKVKNINPLIEKPHHTDYIKIYGSWKNCPYDVSRWGEIGMTTYSFVGEYNGEDKKIFNKANDGRKYRVESLSNLINFFKDRKQSPHMKDRDYHTVRMLLAIKKKRL